MHTMDSRLCGNILVGKIVAAQGLRGEVRVQTYTENPTDFQKLDVGAHICALDNGRKYAPLRIKFIRAIPNSDVIIAHVDNINDRTAAESLRGTELYVNRDTLPALAANEYYQTDLIGMSVVGANVNSPSKVVAIHNFGAGDILELDNGDMVSFIGATVDMENKTIKVK